MTCQSVLWRMIQQNMIECWLQKIHFLWQPHSMYESKLGVTFFYCCPIKWWSSFFTYSSFSRQSTVTVSKSYLLFLSSYLLLKIFPGASAAAQPKSGKFSNKCSPSAIIMEVLCMNCSVLVSPSAIATLSRSHIKFCFFKQNLMIN